MEKGSKREDDAGGKDAENHSALTFGKFDSPKQTQREYDENRDSDTIGWVTAMSMNVGAQHQLTCELKDCDRRLYQTKGCSGRWMVPACVRGTLYGLHDDKCHPAYHTVCHTTISECEKTRFSGDNPDDRKEYAHAHQPVCIM